MALVETLPDPLACSFCGRKENKTRILIAGPAVYICSECIAECNRIIKEKFDTKEKEKECN